MKCPACDQDLVMSDRQGIEIDYCSKCRGVWLDRGELDKIIERSLKDVAPAEPRPESRREPPRDSYPRRDYDDHYKHKHHSRKSWLSELFD